MNFHGRLLLRLVSERAALVEDQQVARPAVPEVGHVLQRDHNARVLPVADARDVFTRCAAVKTVLEVITPVEVAPRVQPAVFQVLRQVLRMRLARADGDDPRVRVLRAQPPWQAEWSCPGRSRCRSAACPSPPA